MLKPANKKPPMPAPSRYNAENLRKWGNRPTTLAYKVTRYPSPCIEVGTRWVDRAKQVNTYDALRSARQSLVVILPDSHFPAPEQVRNVERCIPALTYNSRDTCFVTHESSHDAEMFRERAAQGDEWVFIVYDAAHEYGFQDKYVLGSQPGEFIPEFMLEQVRAKYLHDNAVWDIQAAVLESGLVGRGDSDRERKAGEELVSSESVLDAIACDRGSEPDSLLYLDRDCGSPFAGIEGYDTPEVIRYGKACRERVAIAKAALALWKGVIANGGFDLFEEARNRNPRDLAVGIREIGRENGVVDMLDKCIAMGVSPEDLAA